MQVQDAIDELSKLDPEEDIVITWWTSNDFKGMDVDQAYSLAEDQLESCIGHVNDYVESQYEEEYEEEEEEE